MYCHGVDIGASAVKVLLLSTEKGIIDQAMAPSGYGAGDTARELVLETLSRQNLTPADIRYTIATGYGRVSFAEANEEISEISCLARGARHLYPDAHSVIDVGGQDSKAVRLLPNGHVANFALNDKCAAGTGRFLEVMARILGVALESLGHLSQQATSPVTISSTCTVFAESEVISHISAGASRENIIAGLHRAIADRVLGLAARVGLAPRVVLTGGVANNAGLVETLSSRAGLPLSVPERPEYVSALGAALIAATRVDEHHGAA